MKKSKPCLPRKMKKAAKRMRMDMDKGKPFIPWWYKPYPHTKWVVRMERQFCRLFREIKEKELKIKALEQELLIFTNVLRKIN